jgi:hypothetical protein
MAIGYWRTLKKALTTFRNPLTLVILSEAKDPLHACATTASARNFYHCPAFVLYPLRLVHSLPGNWQLATGS